MNGREPLVVLNVNEPVITDQNWEIAINRLLGVEGQIEGLIPAEVLAEARAESEKPGAKNYRNLSYIVQIYLTPVLSNILGFDDFLWSAHDRDIVKLLQSGQASKYIWDSFQHSQPAMQQQSLQRNPELRRYKQLVDLLSKRMDPMRQRELVDFIANNRTFVHNQMLFDGQLRERLLHSLIRIQVSEFKPLVQFIVQNNKLAQDFEAIFNRIIYANDQRALGAPQPFDPAKDIMLQKDLLNCLVNGSTIATTVLKYPQHFSDRFISEVVLRSSSSSIEEYRAKFNSRLWRAGNAIKSIFPQSLANLLFSEPPLREAVIASMQSVIDITPPPANPARKVKKAPMSSYARQIRVVPFGRPVRAANSAANQESVDLTVIPDQGGFQPPRQREHDASLGLEEERWSSLHVSASPVRDQVDQQRARQQASASSVDLTIVREQADQQRAQQQASASSVDLTIVREQADQQRAQQQASASSVDLTIVREQADQQRARQQASASSVELSIVREQADQQRAPQQGSASSVDLTNVQEQANQQSARQQAEALSVDLTVVADPEDQQRGPQQASTSSVDLTVVEENPANQLPSAKDASSVALTPPPPAIARRQSFNGSFFIPFSPIHGIHRLDDTVDYDEDRRTLYGPGNNSVNDE